MELKMSDSRWKSYPNFKESEFVCPCGCKSSDMDENLIAILQAIRTEFGKPVNITSGMRCAKYNATLEGSIKNSDHLLGKAADFYIPGLTNTAEGRGVVMGFAKCLPSFKYAYCNGYYMSNEKFVTYNASWMGNSIHISVD